MRFWEEGLAAKRQFLRWVTEWYALCPPVRVEEEIIALKDGGIARVVNTGNFPNDGLLMAHGLTVFHPRFPHTGGKQEETLWEQMRAFLLEAKEGGEKVAFHCIGGEQRSVSAVYLALRALWEKTAEEAVELLDAVTTTDPMYAPFIEEWLTAREQAPFPLAFG